MYKETLLKEFRERFPQIMKDLLDEEIKKYPNITNEYWLAIEEFILKAIDQTREETIREEIKYWENVFDNRPKNRDLESDSIAQNFARIEIERLKSLINK